MEDKRIGFETAKLAKEKGFPQLNQGLYFTKDKEHCLVGYGFKSDNFGIYSAPTQSLLQKWLREVHNIHIIVNVGVSPIGTNCYRSQAFTIFGSLKRDIKVSFNMITHEEALEEGLKQALTLIP